MNSQHFLYFSDRPFKSCDASNLRLLGVKSCPHFAQTGEKSFLLVATVAVALAYLA
jgi:hypothetical protein